MPTLICCLSSGKGTWTEVYTVIQAQVWSTVFVITNQFGQENFNYKAPNIKFILIDPFQEMTKIVDQIKKKLQVPDFEVALSLISGSGKEHMAILEAVMELGLNFRLITVVRGQVETLGLQN